MDKETNTQATSLAVSVSGGGHRATLFALGALMYLVDAEANKRVTSIASVSGGSLTNGFVGQTLDFRGTDGATFRKSVATPLASQIAKSGTLFAPLFTKVYLAILVVFALVVFATFAIVPGPWYVRLVAFLVGLTVWGWLFGERGRVCARAFKTTLFSPNGRPTALRELRSDGIDHVICATDLRAAEQVYFGGSFVYSFMLGHGVPGSLPLARAVQASACFPGGFPPTNLRTEQHHFTGAPSGVGGPAEPPASMVLVDGGVYDNMGEQWARGFSSRVKQWPDLGKARLAPNQLVVVNASARIPWVPFRRRLIPLVGELTALLRVNSVMYINTTNVRRQLIVESYDPNAPEKAPSLPGALVQISQSPFVVAKAYAGGAGPVADRANAVLDALRKGPFSEAEWAQIAQENSAVSTSLSKMGVDVTARLLYQAYVVTMCNLHVLFGADFPLRTSELRIERFRELIS